MQIITGCYILGIRQKLLKLERKRKNNNYYIENPTTFVSCLRSKKKKP